MSSETVDKRYLDTALPVDERVEILVSQMTLTEKICQTLYTSPSISRLGVPQYNWWNEALHGVARAGTATVFPQSIGMAASFNESLMFEVATAIADETRAKHHQALRQGHRAQNFGLTIWSPNINIFRDPRWGRGQETYGEDPFLTARLGVAFVEGLQGDDPKYLKTVATPKHYAVHSGPERGRHGFNAIVSQRDLRETYLPAFKACVREGRSHSIMGAYNRTNGEVCCGSPTLLKKILRDEWGFDGYVVSDCHAIKDFHEQHKVTGSAEESAALGVKNGCELNCGNTYRSLLGAIEQGLISEADIDAAVKRLFRARFLLGMFDPQEDVPHASIPADVVRCERHQELALQMARESIVLLKNKNGLLPLSKTVNNVAVVGPNAASDVALRANYYGYAPRMCTPLDGVLEVVSAGTQVTHTEGCHLWKDEPIYSDLDWLITEETEVVIAVMGNSAELEGEEGGGALSDGGGDRPDIGLPGRQMDLLNYLPYRGKPIVLVLMGGSPIDVSLFEDKADAILCAWYPGEAGGRAIADVIFGAYNPAGRLPVTFGTSEGELPPIEDYSMAGRTYRFMTGTPTYHFGHGLSYTTFAYANPSVETSDIRPGDSTAVSVDVTNTGGRAGDEVVQLYIRDTEASVPVPGIRLAGFKRINLEPGETRTVTFPVGPDHLVCYADDGSPFVERGEFELFLGGGQPDDPDAGAVSTVLSVKDL